MPRYELNVYDGSKVDAAFVADVLRRWPYGEGRSRLTETIGVQPATAVVVASSDDIEHLKRLQASLLQAGFGAFVEDTYDGQNALRRLLSVTLDWISGTLEGALALLQGWRAVAAGVVVLAVVGGFAMVSLHRAKLQHIRVDDIREEMEPLVGKRSRANGLHAVSEATRPPGVQAAIDEANRRASPEHRDAPGAVIQRDLDEVQGALPQGGDGALPPRADVTPPDEWPEPPPTPEARARSLALGAMSGLLTALTWLAVRRRRWLRLVAAAGGLAATMVGGAIFAELGKARPPATARRPQDAASSGSRGGSVGVGAGPGVAGAAGLPEATSMADGGTATGGAVAEDVHPFKHIVASWRTTKPPTETRPFAKLMDGLRAPRVAENAAAPTPTDARPAQAGTPSRDPQRQVANEDREAVRALPESAAPTPGPTLPSSPAALAPPRHAPALSPSYPAPAPDAPSPSSAQDVVASAGTVTAPSAGPSAAAPAFGSAPEQLPALQASSSQSGSPPVAAPSSVPSQPAGAAPLDAALAAAAPVASGVAAPRLKAAAAAPPLPDLPPPPPAVDVGVMVLGWFGGFGLGGMLRGVLRLWRKK